MRDTAAEKLKLTFSNGIAVRCNHPFCYKGSLVNAKTINTNFT
jgi:hypothetical protein